MHFVGVKNRAFKPTSHGMEDFVFFIANKFLLRADKVANFNFHDYLFASFLILFMAVPRIL